MKYMKDTYKDKVVMKEYETKEVSTLYDIGYLRTEKQNLLNRIGEIDVLIAEADKLGL